jgi:hypothetical protein
MEMTMKRLIPAVAAGALALAAAFAFAQGTPGYGPGGGYGPGMGGGPGAGMGPGGGYGPGAGYGGGPGFRGQHREQMRAAYEACKGNADVRACMSEQVCAKAQDPAKCQAFAKERHAFQNQRLDERQKMHEACNGKRGDELSSCLIGQRQARATQRIEERQKAHEACNGKRGEELTKCLGEQRQNFRGFGPGRRS